MNTAISILSQLPETRAQIETFTAALKNEIMSGTAEPLHVAMFLKAMEDVVSTLRKDKEVQEVIKDKVIRNHGKCEYSGCTIEIRNKSEYDYSNDPRHVEISEQIALFKQELKDREALLKAIKEPIADANTGEIIEPPMVSNSEILYVTFKK